MARVPDYARPLLKEGELIRCDKATKQWIAYIQTSKRVPGKKHPQKVKVDVAVLSNMGRKELRPEPSPAISIIECKCLEYGASRVLKELLPPAWIRSAGSLSEAIFLAFIKKLFPDSYLLLDVEYAEPEGVNLELRHDSLWEDYNEIGITQESIRSLASIRMLVYPDDHREVTAPTPQQAEMLAALGVTLV